ncbi:MAG: glycosyltransferase family 39 protein [Cyanophyceae cyanobacterium]
MKLAQHQRHFKLLNTLSLFFVLFGIFIRLIQYIDNRSLWADEASLALNIINRSYGELLQPLDHNQAAPPGFLWVEKLATQLLGDSEYALRLFPFVCGLVSLVAFYYLARRYAAPIAAPIAIALFASLRYTIYYTTEVKQYSSDVMIAILLSLLLLPPRRPHKLLLAVSGSVAIWFSHPAVFVLGGLETSTLLSAPPKQRWSLLVERSPVYLAWLLNFALMYFLTISGTLNNETLVDSWALRYPESIFDIVWLLDSLGRFFHRPLGFEAIADGVAAFAFILGCIALFKKNRSLLLALTAPIGATVVASYLHKYPFRDRLVLFLAPFAILIVAEGVSWLLQRHTQRWLMSILGLVILAVLLFPPLTRATQLAIRPERVAEVRAAIEYVQSRQQPGDTFYVYYGSMNQFLYYAPKYGYQDGDYILGIHEIPEEGEAAGKKWQKYQKEIDNLRGQERVWLLFRGKEPEEEALLPYLNRIGRPLDSFKQPGVFVYLYDLRE